MPQGISCTSKLNKNNTYIWLTKKFVLIIFTKRVLFSLITIQKRNKPIMPPIPLLLDSPLVLSAKEIQAQRPGSLWATWMMRTLCHYIPYLWKAECYLSYEYLRSCGWVSHNNKIQGSLLFSTGNFFFWPCDRWFTLPDEAVPTTRSRCVTRIH